MTSGLQAVDATSAPVAVTSRSESWAGRSVASVPAVAVKETSKPLASIHGTTAETIQRGPIPRPRTRLVRTADTPHSRAAGGLSLNQAGATVPHEESLIANVVAGRLRGRTAVTLGHAVDEDRGVTATVLGGDDHPARVTAVTVGLEVDEPRDTGRRGQRRDDPEIGRLHRPMTGNDGAMIEEG